MSEIEPADHQSADQAAPGFDFAQILAQAQQMQADMVDAQERAASELVVGSAGGGLVKVEMNGAMQALSVQIDAQALPSIDPNDLEMLEDLVLAALRDALARAGALGQEAVSGALGGLGGLGGLFG